MKFTLFHLMPYADLDLAATKDYATSWLQTPNTFYDAEKGAALYDRYLGELERGEELGFDGIAVNEQRHTRLAVVVFMMPLFGSGATFDDWIHCLQMARIRCQRKVDPFAIGSVDGA